MPEHKQLSEIVDYVIKEVYDQIISNQIIKDFVLIDEDLNSEQEEYYLSTKLNSMLKGQKACYLAKGQKNYSMIGKRLERQGEVSVREISAFEQIVVIKPSISTLSKLAHLIIDDEYTTIIYESLICSKKVVIGHVSHFNHLNPFLQSEVFRLIEKIKSYGIDILDEQQKPMVAERQQLRKIKMNQKLVTLKDIENQSLSEITLLKGTIISPLAKDYIRQKGIEVNRQEI